MGNIIPVTTSAFASLGKIGPCDPMAAHACAYRGDAGAPAFEYIGGKPSAQTVAPSRIPTPTIPVGSAFNEESLALDIAERVDCGGVKLPLDNFSMIIIMKLPVTPPLQFIFSNSKHNVNPLFGLGYNNGLRWMLPTGAVTYSWFSNGNMRAGAWGFYACSYNAAGGTWDSFICPGAGAFSVKNLLPVTSLLPFDTGENIRINTHVSYRGANDIAYTAVYHNALTAAQMQTQFDVLRAFFDPKLGSSL